MRPLSASSTTSKFANPGPDVMQLARVIGDVVSTVKDPNLSGIKLLVLQPISAGGEATGRTLVALDSVGAGVGENVFFVRGREAAFPFYPGEPPADATVIGIVDSWHLETPTVDRLRQGSGESAEALRAKAERRTSNGTSKDESRTPKREQ